MRSHIEPSRNSEEPAALIVCVSDHLCSRREQGRTHNQDDMAPPLRGREPKPTRRIRRTVVRVALFALFIYALHAFKTRHDAGSHRLATRLEARRVNHAKATMREQQQRAEKSSDTVEEDAMTIESDDSAEALHTRRFGREDAHEEELELEEEEDEEEEEKPRAEADASSTPSSEADVTLSTESSSTDDRTLTRSVAATPSSDAIDTLAAAVIAPPISTLHIPDTWNPAEASGADGVEKCASSNDDKNNGDGPSRTLHGVPARIRGEDGGCGAAPDRAFCISLQKLMPPNGVDHALLILATDAPSVASADSAAMTSLIAAAKRLYATGARAVAVAAFDASSRDAAIAAGVPVVFSSSSSSRPSRGAGWAAAAAAIATGAPVLLAAPSITFHRNPLGSHFSQNIGADVAGLVAPELGKGE